MERLESTSLVVDTPSDLLLKVVLVRVRELDKKFPCKENQIIMDGICKALLAFHPTKTVDEIFEEVTV